MKTNGINKSLLALVLASTATAQMQAAPSTLAERNPTVASKPKFKKSTFKLESVARYKHEKHGMIEGKVILELEESHLNPIDLNQITAEYQGSFYFVSNEKYDNNFPYYEYLGGEDGNIILDLVNKPKKENTHFQGKKYNMHGCNSTSTSCSPLAIQIEVFENGNVNLNGSFQEIEILDNGAWTKTVYDSKLIKE